MLHRLFCTIRQSLRLKIWLSIQLMTLGVLISYLLSHLIIESKTTGQILDTQARLRAEELLNSTFHIMENIVDPSTAHPIPLETLPQDKVSFHILDRDQKIRYSNIFNVIGEQHSLSLIPVDQPESMALTGQERWQSRMENGQFLLTAPLFNENRCLRCHINEPQTLGFVEIAFPIRDVEQLLKKSQFYHVTSGVLLLLIFSLLTLFIIRYLFIQRMSVLAGAIQKISQGSITERIQETSSDEIGQITHQFNRMLDEIEERRREEQEHHQQEINQFDRLATIGELVSGLAHEIRNPIAGISAAIQTLSRCVPASDPTYEVYQQIRGNTDRLDTLVRSLLSYARMEKPRLIPIQLNEVIEQSLLIFKNESNQGCTLIKKIDPNLPMVQGDPRLLQQVLLNILINARQAKETGLELKIETCYIPKLAQIHDFPDGLQENALRCQHGVIQVRITDNGPGISLKDTQSIFRPFITTKPHGTGLGLSISTRIMREHNGCLFARNNSTQGATLVMCMPVNPIDIPVDAVESTGYNVFSQDCSSS